MNIWHNDVEDVIRANVKKILVIIDLGQKSQTFSRPRESHNIKSNERTWSDRLWKKLSSTRLSTIKLNFGYWKKNAKLGLNNKVSRLVGHGG